METSGFDVLVAARIKLVAGKFSPRTLAAVEVFPVIADDAGSVTPTTTLLVTLLAANAAPKEKDLSTLGSLVAVAAEAAAEKARPTTMSMSDVAVTVETVAVSGYRTDRTELAVPVSPCDADDKDRSTFTLVSLVRLSADNADCRLRSALMDGAFVSDVAVRSTLTERVTFCAAESNVTTMLSGDAERGTVAPTTAVLVTEPAWIEADRDNSRSREAPGTPIAVSLVALVIISQMSPR